VDLLERRSGLDGIVNPEVTFWVMMYETTNRLPPRFIIRHRQRDATPIASIRHAFGFGLEEHARHAAPRFGCSISSNEVVK